LDEDEAEDSLSLSEGDSKNKGLKFDEWENEGNKQRFFFATQEKSRRLKRVVMVTIYS
jgi:hypothetical protein